MSGSAVSQLTAFKLGDIPNQAVKTCSLNKKEILQIANAALVKIQELNANLSEMQEQLMHSNDDGGNSYYDSMTDQATRGYDHNFIRSRSINNSKLLTKLEDRITEIKRGEFSDNCVICSKPIPLQRLLAVPATNCCCSCKDNGNGHKNNQRDPVIQAKKILQIKKNNAHKKKR